MECRLRCNRLDNNKSTCNKSNVYLPTLMSTSKNIIIYLLVKARDCHWVTDWLKLWSTSRCMTTSTLYLNKSSWSQTSCQIIALNWSLNLKQWFSKVLQYFVIVKQQCFRIWLISMVTLFQLLRGHFSFSLSLQCLSCIQGGGGEGGGRVVSDGVETGWGRMPSGGRGWYAKRAGN